MRRVTLLLASLSPIDWIGAALVLVLSFSITLWLTEPEIPLADKIPWLAASAISDESSLHTAADKIGLKRSSHIKGHVDELRRTGGEVMITGWAVERGSTGEPMTVMIFVEGHNILNAETRGERPDVTSALNLTTEAARNAAFSGRLKCDSRSRLLVVAASVSGRYDSISTVSCP
jgi:hypothetical protein